jgi:dipeptidyl aminopeptidase/acylaminoacyl peptidase
MLARLACLLLGTLLLAGCAPRITVPLIARETIFGNPQRAAVALSPDGQRLAYLAPLDGVMNLWVAPLTDLRAAQPVTRDRGRGVRQYLWAYTSQHLLYVQDQDGDENWRVFCVDLATHAVRNLTPQANVQARIEGLSPRFPDAALIGLNARDPQWHDLYRISITTGQQELVLQNDGYASILADDDYQPRLGTRFNPDGGTALFLRAPAGDWTPFADVPPGDALTTSPAGFDRTGRQLYLLDSRDRDTAGLFVVDLATRQSRLIAADPRADVSGVLAHPVKREVEAVAFTYERKHWQVVDPAVQADVDVLTRLGGGDFEVVSRTLADDDWIVACTTDAGPVRYYHYNRPRQQADFLFTGRPALENLPLARMHPVVIPARDGLPLVSYLSLPVDSDPDHNARPTRPLPLVLWVHGGPWAREEWGYHPYHQWLTNRGYAVLAVNFRSSTGFGKRFVNAGDHEWGGKMQDDLVDALRWAINEHIADPQRVAIMGASYGGYATLVGLTATPDLFVCGVDMVGPANLITLIESIPPYWKPLLDMFTTRIGDPRTEAGREFLASRSPLTHVDRIARPLLIAQGANDARVKQAESDSIVRALQEKHIPVTYVLFPNEGHGFERPENNLAFCAIVDAFLAAQLGGRSEPIGADVSASSAQVPAGAEFVPGLAQSVRVR